MNFFEFKNNLELEKGRLLISEPFLPDPNFERTVVLLCEHNDEGSFGFVLNKPSAITLDAVMDTACDIKEIVHIGGPVQQDTLFFIHRSHADIGGVDLGNGLFWGGDFEKSLTMVRNSQVAAEDFKFFVGYSGWSARQLQEEVDANSWIVTPYATHELVFDQKNDDLWKTVLKGLGGRFNMYSNYPIDPRLN